MENGYFYLIQIAAIYVACIGFGFVMRRIKQPVVLGYIAAGILLGLFGFMKPGGTVPELIVEFSQIGVIFLLFIAGLETDISELANSGMKSLVIALGGIIVSGGLATLIFTLIKGNLTSGIFLGVVVTATSVSISVQTLREMGKMKTKEGVSIIGAAILDDIIGILLITIMLGMFSTSGGESESITHVLVSIGSFFGLLALIGLAVILIVKHVKHDTYFFEVFAIIAMTTCLIIAFLASQFGVATIIGAYFCGLIFSATDHSHRVCKDMIVISDVIFMPIFFASIGLGISMADMGSALGVGLMLSVVAIAGKVVGCGFGAKIMGFDTKESLRIGTGMIPRGEVTIITAGLGASIGMLSNADVAATIVLVLVTAMITPPILKAVFKTPAEIGNDNA